MTDFTNARTQTIQWVNEHGTFKKSGVTRILPIASAGDFLARWQRVGQILQEVVGHAFDHNDPLRPDGSRWSLSKIGVPKNLALSLAAHDVLEQVPDTWVSSRYAAKVQATGLTPTLVSGSMKIGRINRLLTMRDMALQTSGASDGQTLAGATATGTHGAAINLGSIHDTIRAVHLMVGPNKAIWVQPSSKPFKQKAATSLTSWLGFPTEIISDDAVFEAAIVHLGSMGIVLNMVVEVEPLYFLTSVITPHVTDEWRDVLSTLTPAGIAGHVSDPFHLQVLLTPYKQKPKTGFRAWVRTMHKTLYTGQPNVKTDPSHHLRPNPDLIALLATLGNVLDVPTGFRRRMTKELTKRYGDEKKSYRGLPGVMFGPSALPKGEGHSVEYVVDGRDALPALEIILDALDTERLHGRQLLGAIGVRFVGGSRATLAPNTKSPTCFIELPCIRTRESVKIYEACGAALSATGIEFGCHWGQYLTHTKKSLRTYWSPEQRDSWVAARKELLKTQKARTVFASPILGPAGLG